MITRFKIPVPRPARITATLPPSASMPTLLLFVEVEVAKHDVERGIMTLRGWVPIEGRIVKTPWMDVANDIAMRTDRLRDFLTFQAWEQHINEVDARETEERWA